MEDNVKTTTVAEGETTSREPDIELQILHLVASTLMHWLPYQGYSKIILIPHPKIAGALVPVHLAPEIGAHIISAEDFKGICEEILCEECVVKLDAYSIIHTGINLDTGDMDDGSFVGLEGGHESEEQERDLGSYTDQEFDDEFPDFNNMNIPKKRTLN